MKMLKKLLTLALFCSISSLKLSAQSVKYTWDNQSGCDWEIQAEDNMGVPTVAGSVTAFALTGTGTVPASGCMATPSNGKIRFKNLGCGCELTADIGTSTTINVTSDCLTQGCDPVYCTTTPTTTQITVVQVATPLTCLDEYTITI